MRRSGDPPAADDGGPLWRKVRRPVRVMRKRAPQFGSGQAMSVSVVIQSWSSVGRCLAAAAAAVPPAYGERLAGGKAQVFAAHLEGSPATWRRRRPAGGDDLDPEVAAETRRPSAVAIAATDVRVSWSCAAAPPAPSPCSCSSSPVSAGWRWPARLTSAASGRCSRRWRSAWRWPATAAATPTRRVAGMARPIVLLMIVAGCWPAC